MHPPNDKDTVLFRQIGGGDTTAFENLFHYYNARLFPFIQKLTKSSAAAENIIQEVFLRVWLNREQVAGMDYPAAWLYKVASNLSISWLRQESAAARRIRILQDRQPQQQDDLEDNFSARELQSVIDKAVAALSPRSQQIYRLSREQGLSHKEIAEQLGISQNTVKNQLVISLKFLHHYISAHSGIPAFLLLLGNFKKFL